MKTIRQSAIETFPDCNNEQDQKTVEMFRHIYIRGAIFSRRWISIEEELPEESMRITSKGNYTYTPQIEYKTKNNKVGITRREEFLDHGFQWRGSGSLQDGIISWRTIELT
jgi:hypothetical protein